MSDITTSVTQFWNFLWPAALNFAVIISIVAYCTPTPGHWLKQQALSIPSIRLIRFFHSKTAEALGISKLVPFVTFFLFLLILVVFKDVASFIGNEVPPVMYWTSPNSYIMNADNHSLQLIWRQLPEKSELNQLARFIDEKWIVLGKDSGYFYLSERANRLHTIFDALKFYSLLVVLLIFFGITSRLELRLRKAASLLVFLSSILVLNGAYIVYTQKRLIESKVSIVQNWASLQKATISNESETEREQTINSRRRSDLQWWSVGLPAWSW